MIVLAIESSTRNWNAAILEGDRIRGQSRPDPNDPISRNLAPVIQRLITEARLTPPDLDLIAVTRGPGAFTPLRVGITAAKSFAFALDLPVVAADALQLLTIGAASTDNWPHDVTYWALIDAQRDEFFFAGYRFEQPWQPVALGSTCITSLDDLLLERSWDPPVVCIGPSKWGARLAEIGDYRPPTEDTAVTLARWAIRLAERGEVQRPMEVLPEYGRPSYAEEPRRKID